MMPERRPEHRWPATIAITIAVLFYLLLPDHGTFLPRWIAPTILGVMLVPLLILNPHHFTRETVWSRALSIGLAVVLTLANQVEVVSVIVTLVSGAGDAPAVLLTALQVWLTDVVAFGLIYWELDRGGPFARRMTAAPPKPDFRFPQEDDRSTTWQPGLVDYLYFSLSNMMAFSPTDVMPLTARAKGFMALQAFIGFMLLALVISRAVNILA